eukprot:COSAG04_NODE_824_length_10051_cov_4.830687_2_plen_1826_part_00
MPVNALHRACGFGQKDWAEAQRLVDRTPGGGAGADEAAAALCREKDGDGWLPLHFAAQCGAPAELIGAMLAVDAEAAAAKDRCGELPLDLAVMFKAAPEVLDLLRKASGLAVAIERKDWAAIGRLGLATPEACAAVDGEGYAPLHVAQIKGAPPEVWEAIRAAGPEPPPPMPADALLQRCGWAFQVGDKVQRRDGTEAWAVGFVTQVAPLKVNMSDTDPSEAGYSWDEVRPYGRRSDGPQEPNWPEAQRLVDPTPGGGAGADEAAAALCREKDDMFGRLPLHWAVIYGAPAELIGAMLAVDAEAAAAKDINGELPLDVALQAKAAPEVLLALVEAAPDAAEDKLPTLFAGKRFGDDQAQRLCACLDKTHLTALALSGNELTAVPPALCGIVSLQTLDLSGNAIAELPPELLRLTELRELKLSANELTAVPLALCKIATLQTLDLSGNTIADLPLELTQLTELTKFDASGNPALEAMARIGEEKGVPGIFEYLRDLNDDPQPSFSLKLLLAGPSMAGKSSLVRGLMRKAVTLTTIDQRTIGLEIEKLTLRDPAGRAPNGIEFIAYDAGGHDEYMEIHQIFVTSDTLFLLLWNLKKEITPQMVEELARWATLIQTCAPGSKVLLVGSHADEVAGGEAVVVQRCRQMSERVHAELAKYRQTQQNELDRLSSMQTLSPDAAERVARLQRVLSQPLRLAAEAIPVSAKTLEGFEELEAAMVAAAFDKDAFPSFGSSQPGTYGAIHRQLLRAHPKDSSVTWDQMQESLVAEAGFDCARLAVAFVGSHLSDGRQEDALAEPEPEAARVSAVGSPAAGLVGSLQCQTGWFGSFESARVELSRAGLLTVKLAQSTITADLTKAGTKVGEPKAQRSGHPFCVRVDAVDPAQKIVLDMANATDHQRWLEAMRQAVGSDVASAAKLHRVFAFTVRLDDEELKQFTVRHRNAKAVHKQLQTAKVAGELVFPDSAMDSLKGTDYTRDETNWRRRSQEMLEYYQALFKRPDALSHPAFKDAMGFELEELEERHSRVSSKVRKDPALVKRAMLFLGVTGEVLCPRQPNGGHHPQAEPEPEVEPEPEPEHQLADRVFLRPQWLIDVMKEFVRHDLRTMVDTIDSSQATDVAQVKALGELFCDKGVLDRRLLPWLWRNLPFPLAQKSDEIDFLLGLLTELGLLTLLPHQQEPRWLLPLRLPDKDLDAPASVALAQAKFDVFVARMGNADLLEGMEAKMQGISVLDLEKAISFIEGPGTPTQAVLKAACTVALDAAKKLLPDDPHGLTLDDIAAIHLYTQEDPIYTALNKALRSDDRDTVKAYWGYIKLLQSALFKLPKDETGTTLNRGIKIVWGPEGHAGPVELEHKRAAWAEMKLKLEGHQKTGEPLSGEPLIWWGFSSTSTSLPTVQEFLGDHGPRVIFSVDGGSSARDVRLYSAIPKEDELLLPCGSAFTVNTIGCPAQDLLMVSLKQTNTVLMHASGSQAVAVPPTPAQHEALAQFARALSTGTVDEVCRRFDFHQPLPAGLMAVAISACAELCGQKTSVWRQALSTIMTDNGLELEVSMQQSGLSRIDFVARCAAGDHHDICLRKLKQLQEELQGVIDERWPGCTHTEMCLAAGTSVPLSECERWRDRGEVGLILDGGASASLVHLLGSAASESPLEPAVQAQARTLQCFRALAAGVHSIGATTKGRRFRAALDAELDAQLGGSFADGHRWRTELQTDAYTPEVLGEDLTQVEEQAASDERQSRAIALLAALGRLYERSHQLLAAEAVPLGSMADVCGHLLSPFPRLEASLRKLAEEHGLRDVEKPALKAALAMLDEAPQAIPEGVPPPGFEPEPEPA